MKYAKSVWDTKITGIKKSKTKKAKKKTRLNLQI